MTTNYNNVLNQLIQGGSLKGKRLLLHVCCAPCASAVCERLCDTMDVTLYFYNPNIDTLLEHDKRQDQLQKLKDRFNIKSILSSSFDPAPFNRVSYNLQSEKEGGKRCGECIYLRLKNTAELAKEQGYDYFCTTLSISPHKNSTLINQLGQAAQKETGVYFLPSDFKKQDGYKRSIILSDELSLYRQDYCGCSYAKGERL